MSAKQHQYPYSGHPKDQTRPDQNCIRISFQPDWQIDNGFFNKPIMVCTQIVRFTGGCPEQGFQRCFAVGLNQSLVSSVEQATKEV